MPIRVEMPTREVVEACQTIRRLTITKNGLTKDARQTEFDERTKKSKNKIKYMNYLEDEISKSPHAERTNVNIVMVS